MLSRHDREPSLYSQDGGEGLVNETVFSESEYEGDSQIYQLLNKISKKVDHLDKKVSKIVKNNSRRTKKSRLGPK
jgi:hypothetical protein